MADPDDTHSVERHLSVAPSAYDHEIRRFIPGYDQMLDEVAGALADLYGDGAGAQLLDLGGGTGALTERVAARLPAARFVVVDVDAAMLAQAAVRLAPLGGRVTLREGSFRAPLPPSRAAMATLALHHVHEPAAKRATYRTIAEALAPGGALVIGDAFVAERGPLHDAIYRRWTEHLCAHGHREEEARARFVEWAREDSFFPLADELRALAESGFGEVDVRWRLGPMAVVVALRP